MRFPEPWSSTSLAKQAVPRHCQDNYALDRAFSLIEGQPFSFWGQENKHLWERLGHTPTDRRVELGNVPSVPELPLICEVRLATQRLTDCKARQDQDREKNYEEAPGQLQSLPTAAASSDRERARSGSILPSDHTRLTPADTIMLPFTTYICAGPWRT